jgi:hypothetical protein
LKKVILILIVFSNTVFAQELDKSEVLKDSINESFVCGRHSVSGGLGKYALYYLNYEFKLIENKWFKTTASFGYGGAPGDSEVEIPSYNNLSLGINQYVGFRPVFISIGLIPTLNFYGKVTYIELNGKLGLQYVFKNCDNPILIEAGRIVRLYRTHYNDVGPAFYIGFGVNIN